MSRALPSATNSLDQEIEAAEPGRLLSRVSLGVWRLGRVVGDLIAGLGALACTFLVRVNLPLPFTESLLPTDRLAFFAVAAVVVTVTQNPLLYFFGFYELPRPGRRAERLRRLTLAAFFQGLLLMGFYFLADRDFPRSVVVLYVPTNLLLMMMMRVALDRLLLPPQRRAAIVGTGPSAWELARDIERYHWHGLEIVGHLTSPSDPSAGKGPREPLGSVEDIPDLLAAGRFDDIILTGEADNWQSHLIDRLASRADVHTSLLLLPGPMESLIGRMRYRSIHDIPLIEVVRESEWHARRPLKRIMDLALAVPLLILTAPAILACGLAVRITSPGPMFYSQSRVGRDRRRFTLHKLRTMRIDAEEVGEEVLAVEQDPRLTRVGSVLRSLRLDELPQLINVINGSMSLVGPRPERPGFTRKFLEEVPGYAARFSIQPGLTGLAQVNGDYLSSPENKIRYDLAYLANWSIWLDISILVRTVRIILTSRGI